MAMAFQDWDRRRSQARNRRASELGERIDGAKGLLSVRDLFYSSLFVVVCYCCNTTSFLL
jgi:hypothetical protein